ncbi:MAG: MBL fold metallo-hydrolase [Proteobacteria bacterium]|nr:MBL fold metallo-hydrolase [Pseudomonadota bacterium]
MTNNHLRHIFIIFIIISLSGCAQYSRDMLWENKIKPTPYDAPDHFVRPDRWSDEYVTYAWLGYATVLINFYGTWIITDPVLLDRIGPPVVFDNLFGIKRITQLPLADNELPAVDIVLVSHPHFDHLDLASLRLLNESANYNLVVPALTKDLIGKEIKTSLSSTG